MKEHDRDSLESLVGGLEVFNETTIDFLIHFVKVFEVYSGEVWLRSITEKNVSKQTLILGAKHPRWGIRCTIAENPRTLESTLGELAKDKSEYVRGRVAENPNTPIGILKILSKDEYWSVRLSVARNQNTSIGINKKLRKDENWIVKEIASERLSGRQNGRT